MAISKEAVNGTEFARILRLLGTVQGREVTMLVDSGSSHCFVSEEIVRQSTGAQNYLKPVQVRIADGSMLRCTTEVPHCRWDVQGNILFTTFRILPLGGYDAILGIDWLEQHNPMNTHWLKKIMSF